MACKLLVSGAMACFPRPGFRESLESYDVLTPLAAIQILESVLWRRSARYEIESILVIKKIKHRWIDCAHLFDDAVNDQRRVRALIDVEYAVTARVELTSEAAPDEAPGKYVGMFRRRLSQRRLFRRPYLGLPRCSANVSPLPPDYEPVSYYGAIDSHHVGWLPFPQVGESRFPIYADATMRRGLIDFTDKSLERVS